MLHPYKQLIKMVTELSLVRPLNLPSGENHIHLHKTKNPVKRDFQVNIKSAIKLLNHGCFTHTHTHTHRATCNTDAATGNNFIIINITPLSCKLSTTDKNIVYKINSDINTAFDPTDKMTQLKIIHSKFFA